MSALTSIELDKFCIPEFYRPRKNYYPNTNSLHASLGCCQTSDTDGFYSAAAAECLSGITIHQVANPGALIVWDGAPALFDMRDGTILASFVETMLLVIGYAQVG